MANIITKTIAMDTITIIAIIVIIYTILIT